MSEKCCVPGCEITPDTQARGIWEEAEKRGYSDSVFRGKCMAHIRDTVARRKVETIEAEKQEAKKVATNASKRHGQDYHDGEITSKKTALLLMVSVTVVHNLIELGFLRSRKLRGGHDAIEFESVREFVEIISYGDFSGPMFKQIPEEVLDKLYDSCPDIDQNLRLHEEKNQNGVPD